MGFQEFWTQFYKKYIGYGSYQLDELKVYETKATFGVFSKYHIILATIMISFIILYTFLTRKYSSKKLYESQKKISVVMLMLEILRMIWLIIYRPEEHFIRFDYCNQICLFMPILILLGLNYLNPALMTISFWGGFGVMCYPLWVFRPYGGFHIMSIQSMISHGLMLLTSINLCRTHKIDFKNDFKISVIIFSIMALISLITSHIRQENYMAMLKPDGLPIIDQVNPPFHIIFVVSAVYLALYLYLIIAKRFEKYIICYDLKEENNNEI